MPDAVLPERLAVEAVRLADELRLAGNSDRAANEKRYLKSELEHYGVAVPRIRRAVKAMARRAGELDRIGLVTLAEELWRSGVHELRMAAVEALVLGRDRLTAADVPVLERLLREARTWALVDPLAIQVVGPVIGQDAAARGLLLSRWVRDGDFWVRRSALLALLLPVRSGDLVAFGEFTELADQLLEDREFFVAKAIGWVLREGTKRLADDVFHWLLPRAGRATRLTVREAAKNLPPERKEALLQAR